jgi:hypothetical protein
MLLPSFICTIPFFVYRFNRVLLQLHRVIFDLILRTLTNLNIVEKDSDWLIAVIARMIISLIYLVAGLTLLENFGWQMDSLKVRPFFQAARKRFLSYRCCSRPLLSYQSLFAVSTLGPLFVASTETFRNQVSSTISLLMRKDLRDAKAKNKRVIIGDDISGHIMEVDLRSITLL